MSGIADVARLAGVSKATASRALSGNGHVSESTRSRVQTAAREIGYVGSPNAASLVTGRTQNIAVLVPTMSRWFFSQVLQGIEQSLLDRGWDMTVYNVPEKPTPQRLRVFDFFLARKRFDAVIAVCVALTPAEVDTLTRLGKPVVGLGGPIEGADWIAIDDAGAARLATEHLVRLGHRDIAHLGGRLDAELGFPLHLARRRGWLEAMAAAGLETDGRYFTAPMDLPGGYAAALRVLGDPRERPTAVFAASDELAVGCILAARDLGIAVPSELSVIGIDGHEYAEMFRLTTIEQYPYEQGATAVGVALDRLESGASDVADARELPTALVVRASTTAPRPRDSGLPGVALPAQTR